MALGYKMVMNNYHSFVGDMQYEIGETYVHDGPIKICESGFHFCKELANVFTIFDIKSHIVSETRPRVLVIRYDEQNCDCSFEALYGKSVTKAIEVVCEIPTEDLYKRYVNYERDKIFRQPYGIWAYCPIGCTPDEILILTLIHMSGDSRISPIYAIYKAIHDSEQLNLQQNNAYLQRGVVISITKLLTDIVSHHNSLRIRKYYNDPYAIWILNHLREMLDNIETKLGPLGLNFHLNCMNRIELVESMIKPCDDSKRETDDQEKTITEFEKEDNNA